jgi:hypothetical protein
MVSVLDIYVPCLCIIIDIILYICIYVYIYMWYEDRTLITVKIILSMGEGNEGE